MKLGSLIMREFFFRKKNAVLEWLSITLAVAVITGTVTYLTLYDAGSSAMMQEKETALQKQVAEMKNEMRKASLKLSFNLYIFPKQQSLKDWYADDNPSAYMPENYVEKLAGSGIVTVRHFLPSLQQKIKWPETGRTIILIGTRGEVPNLHKNPVKPLVQSVPEGRIVLGYELHNSLNLQTGAVVQLMGRAYTVHTCYDERGSKDDITAWIPLKDAQHLLKKENQISSILALECMCAGPGGLAIVRKELEKILPDTKVIELGSKALARFEARSKINRDTAKLIKQEKARRNILKRERETFASIIVPFIVIFCMVWLVLLSLNNVRERTTEIGMLRTIGFKGRQVLLLFLGKSVVIGILGALTGYLAGVPIGAGLYHLTDGALPATLASLFNGQTLLITILLTAGLAILAGWLPAWMAANKDPADTLREG